MSQTTSQAEREDLRASVRSFLATTSGEDQVRRLIGDERGWDESVWRRMADELGLLSLTLPPDHGGDGFGAPELQVVLEEQGRALLPSPYFSTVVLAATALAASGDEAAQATHLPAIGAGTTTATLAVAEADGSWRTDRPATTAVRAGSGWTLSGTKQLVVDGATADVVLVVAGTDAGPGLFAVAGDDPGLTRTPLRTLDPTRRIARLEFADAAAVPVGAPGAAGAVVDRVLDVATAALAAEQVGAARACLEAAVGYARERVQFGRAIGSFQAVKHKCADMFVRVQLADAAATEAAAALAGGEGLPDPGVAAAVAHVVCSEAFMFVAAENIQVHGGIGFTWEHPAHLYFRRAKSSQLLFGGPAAYHERLLARLGV
ncbi:MAG: putative acyl-CoA dehydrogenase [Frankiales bacterium]|nr:putative acyl-CoA dehydrogenase [Frankiales bacterium]